MCARLSTRADMDWDLSVENDRQQPAATTASETLPAESVQSTMTIWARVRVCVYTARPGNAGQ